MADQVHLKVNFELEREIRRFNIPVLHNNGVLYPSESPVQAYEGTLYACILKKIEDKLHHQNFRLNWTENGEAILFDSDEELQVALAARNGDQVLSINVKTISPPQYQKPETAFAPFSPAPPAAPALQGSLQQRSYAAPPRSAPNMHGLEKHKGVLCDGCDMAIVGTRYKCLTCPDYDLCLKCEQKGLHCDHDCVAIRKPNQFDWRKLFAARECSYGRQQSPPGAGETASVRTHQHHDGPVVELDLNLNQPLENLLRDVNTQVQKVLRGFMPQNIPETATVSVSTAEVPEVVVQDRKETLVETVVQDEVPAPIKGNEVETLHESVVEQGNASLEEKVEAVNIYPELATATEQAEIVNVAESLRSPTDSMPSPSSSFVSVSTEDDGWALVSETASVSSKDADTDTASLPKDSPSAQVDAALVKMVEMGFKNEGNLLRALLENFNGNIDKVLDTIGTI